MSEDGVSQSKFFMWRTLFSVAHADNVVTDEEIEYMARVLENINFTDEQTAILKDDISYAKDVEEMFKGITDQEDRNQFFDFARDLVWVDGDFASEEQGVMVKLLKTHFKETNFDDLVGRVSLELEDDRKDSSRTESHGSQSNNNIRAMLSSFQQRFLDFIHRD